jgi:hypothetical protein
LAGNPYAQQIASSYALRAGFDGRTASPLSHQTSERWPFGQLNSGGNSGEEDVRGYQFSSSGTNVSGNPDHSPFLRPMYSDGGVNSSGSDLAGSKPHYSPSNSMQRFNSYGSSHSAEMNSMAHHPSPSLVPSDTYFRPAAAGSTFFNGGSSQSQSQQQSTGSSLLFGLPDFTLPMRTDSLSESSHQQQTRQLVPPGFSDIHDAQNSTKAHVSANDLGPSGMSGYGTSSVGFPQGSVIHESNFKKDDVTENDFVFSSNILRHLSLGGEDDDGES